MKEIITIVAIVILLSLCSSAYPQKENQSSKITNSNLINSTNDFLTINTPYNTSRLEIVLKNGNQGATSNETIDSAIAAGAAVTGAIVGSSFTYLTARWVENRKAENQKKREKDFNTNIRKMVHYELESYKNFIENEFLRKSKSLTEDDAQANPDIWYIYDNLVPDTKARLAALPKQYSLLNVERKANVFDGQHLEKLERAYQGFGELSLETKPGHPGSFYKSKVNSILTDINNALNVV